MSALRLIKPITYNTNDRKGETIKNFYQQELQKANQEVYRIDKVPRTKEALVKWKWYSYDFNSWVPESDIQK